MNADPWLDRWLPLLRDRSPAGPLLELGCGWGRDTATLLAAGGAVVAADIEHGALRGCAVRAPGARLIQLDLATPLPFGDGSFPVVIASLSLHYFPWPVTVQIVAEIGRCLRPAGMLIARFNSTEDVHHGAASVDEIGPGYKLFEGSPKRFFDRAAVVDLLRGWEIGFLEHAVIHRYDKPKAVWEAMARRRVPPPP